MVFDCRFLSNPYWQADLRPLDGRSPAVAAFVRDDPRFAEFFRRLQDLVLFLLPAHLEEGKSHSPSVSAAPAGNTAALP